MFPVLRIGPLAIQTPALFVLSGIWVGLMLVKKFAGRYSIPFRQLENLTLWFLFSGLVGARVFYFLRFPQAFFANPLAVILPSPFLLDFEGGALVAVLVTLVYGQRHKMPFWETLDALTPGFAVFVIALGLAHIASGNAYGIRTSLPWGIELWGAIRHPVQIYETLLAVLILWIVLPAKPDREEVDNYQVSGMLFLEFVALSAASQLILETFRAVGVRWFGVVRMEQIIAWLVLALALWLIGQRRKQGVSLRTMIRL